MGNKFASLNPSLTGSQLQRNNKGTEMKLSKSDKKAIKLFVKLMNRKPECKEQYQRSIDHILDRARNPKRYEYRG